METFRPAWLLIVSLAVIVQGQQQQLTCPATLAPECYFTGAATRRPGQSNTNKYFVIGGFFDIHHKGPTAYVCGSEMQEISVINLQAFFWAIEKYSLDILQGKGVTVGAVAFDSCMRNEQTIENLLGYAQCKLHIQGMLRENLVAYIGPYTNDDVRSAGKLASDLGVTMITPTADAFDLSVQDQRTLLRMSPSFEYDLKAIVEFLKHVRTEYVIILYSGEHELFSEAYQRLRQQIDSVLSTDICIQYVANVDGMTDSELREELRKQVSVKYVVPLISEYRVSSLMSEIEADIYFPKQQLVFILNSHIGRNKALLASKAITGNNTIIIDRVVPDGLGGAEADFNSFANYLSNVISNSSLPYVSNPWVAEYLQNHAFPDLRDDDVVTSPLRLSILRTLLSVKAVIMGMDAVITDCNVLDNSVNNYQFCDTYRNQHYKEDNLLAKFKAALNIHEPDSGRLQNVYIEYEYYHFIVDNGVKFEKIGEARVNSIGGMQMSWSMDPQDTARYGTIFSLPACPVNERCCEPVTVRTAPPFTTTLTPSTPGSSTEEPEEDDVQVWYPRNQEITGVYALNRDHYGYDHLEPGKDSGTRFDLSPSQKWIIALGVLAGLGILCVFVFEIYILYKLLGTRMGQKWRTMWLGQLLLFGIFLCYLTCIAYIWIPTKATCGITRFGVGVSYAWCFAVLLVKLMVILTSKSSDVLLPESVESPNYLKGVYQFLMFIFALSVQLVIAAQWMITIPPEAVHVKSNNGEMVWICNHYTWESNKDPFNMEDFVRTNFENHLMSLIYVMVLILITTFLSLKAHGIITNHRESVFIGIAAGFSIPIWLAWALVGGLNKDHDYAHEFGDACTAFGLICTATLILFAMFLPKVRQLVNLGVEGIYLEDDRDTYYAGSVIMAPPSYKSKGPGPGSVIYVNNQGIYSEPVIVGNGVDPNPMATYLKHPGSTYSAPPGFVKNRPDSVYGGSTRVLRVTDDLKGRHPGSKRAQSEVAYAGRPRSEKGTLKKSGSATNLGAL